MQKYYAPESKIEHCLSLDDPTAEARRIIMTSQQQGLILRALGGTAIGLRCTYANTPDSPGHRSYSDIDLMASRKQGLQIQHFCERIGYRSDHHFNVLHGEHRLVFFDKARYRYLDVFLSSFSMGQTLNIEPRLRLHPLTISPADLLLTKIQVSTLRSKDILDLLTFFLNFEPVISPSDPGQQLDLSLIVTTCSRHWGWHTTALDNLSKLYASAYQRLSSEQAALARERIQQTKMAIELHPKTWRWRLRSIIGRHVPWYEVAEEFHPIHTHHLSKTRLESRAISF